jgi:hypothetical protein
MGRTLTGFLAFLLIGTGKVWILLVLLFLGLLYAHRRAPSLEWRKYWLLAIMPMMWIFVGLWGSYFWKDPRALPIVPNPEWVTYVIGASLLIFLVCGLGAITCFRGARWFVTIYFAINLYFMLAMSFLSTQAVTGEWL